MGRSVPGARPPPAIPQTVWTLGFVSLLMDMSSELIHSLLPVFLVSTLGASVLAVDFIEGVAEASALVAKVFSGAMSDYFRNRKGLLLLGYGMAALTKPLFPLAASAETVFVARFLDRVGKGIRGAPRDALVADVAPRAIRGACFGLRQSMDTVGAILGPALAMVMMFWFGGEIRLVLWVAVAPACVTVLLILFGVKDPISSRDGFRSPIRPGILSRFSGDFWRIVAIGSVFTLARFSEAFLVLRAQQAGFTVEWVPLVMIVMSLAYALSAYPAGIVSDHVDRRHLLAAGIVLLIVADLLLAFAGSPSIVLVGVGLWGLHMGCTQGRSRCHDRAGHAAGIEGHRLRALQSCERPFHAAGQRDRGRAMRSLWSVDDFRYGRCAFAFRLVRVGFACALGNGSKAYRAIRVVAPLVRLLLSFNGNRDYNNTALL